MKSGASIDRIDPLDSAQARGSAPIPAVGAGSDWWTGRRIGILELADSGSPSKSRFKHYGRKILAFDNPIAIEQDTCLSTDRQRDELRHRGPRTQRPSAGLKLKFWTLMVTLLSHVVMVSVLDTMLSRDPVKHLLAFTFQTFLMVVIAILFFMLTAETTMVMAGMFNLLLLEFRWFFASLMLYFIVSLAYGIYHVVLLYQDTPQVDTWLEPGYTACYIVNKLALLAFYCAALWSSLRSLDPRFHSLVPHA